MPIKFLKPRKREKNRLKKNNNRDKIFEILKSQDKIAIIAG